MLEPACRCSKWRMFASSSQNCWKVMPVIRTLKPFGKKYRSHVSWSHRPRGTLLIFVHGFLGNALSTWQFFDQFMEQTGLDDCDIVFWGHSAGRRNVAAPVAQLFELVNSFWNS